MGLERKTVSGGFENSVTLIDSNSVSIKEIEDEREHSKKNQ